MLPSAGEGGVPALNAAPSADQNPSNVNQAAGEAARLWARGGRTEARIFLERQLRSEWSEGERLWLMLLALYEETGERNLFGKLAQDFAIRFKRSSPVWRGPSVPHVDAMQDRGGAPVTIGGRLSSESAPQIDRLRALADSNHHLQMDFSRLKGMDPAGCEMLLALLQRIRKRGGDSSISGDGTMLQALAKVTRLGARDVPEALWKLHLELLQWQGRQAEFGRVGRDYADTFSASPPSYESIVPGGAAPDSQPGAFATPAEIEGFGHSFFEELARYAATRSLVQVNLSGLTRIDFWATARLVGTATQLKAATVRLELLWPNVLVAEWLTVMGVGAIAAVVHRRP